MVVAIVMLLPGALAASAQTPDPYRWCADYGGWRGGGASNCGFLTLEQCRATISGIGGTCRPNPFYTGPGKKPQQRSKQKRTY
jgi:hypothetical protein